MIRSLAPTFAATAIATVASAASPDARALADALSRPSLVSCDELICHYRRGRAYSIRNLRCRPAPEQGVACSYERRSADRPPRIVSPPELARHATGTTSAWTAASTVLKRVEGQWLVLDDSDG